jgi:hypothetical protein
MSDIEPVKQAAQDIAEQWLKALPAGRYAADKRARAVLEQFVATGEVVTEAPESAA